jgi:hypothetical protein
VSQIHSTPDVDSLTRTRLCRDTPYEQYRRRDTLVNKGLVSKGSYDGRTNVYMLTERGQRELEARRDREAEYVSLG